MTSRTLLIAVAAVAVVSAGIGCSQTTRVDPPPGRASQSARQGARSRGHRVPLGGLRAGTCFDAVPGVQGAVAVVACARPHLHEAFAVRSLRGPRGAPYPGDAALVRRARLACERALVATRHVSLGETSYGLFPVIPIDSATWDRGSRRLVCALFPISMEPVTGRLR